MFARHAVPVLPVVHCLPGDFQVPRQTGFDSVGGGKTLLVTDGFKDQKETVPVGAVFAHGVDFIGTKTKVKKSVDSRNGNRQFDGMTQRQPRLLNPKFLAFVRGQPCVICGKLGSDAAHIRSGNEKIGKRSTGLGEKPSDQWVTPLCREHHDEQHKAGDELKWWASKNLDPFVIATVLFTRFGERRGQAKGPRKIKPRKPREQRAKISSRSSFK